MTAPAKINLCLQVLGRREDGYHGLETIFLPVPDIRDSLTLTLVGGDAVTIRCSHPDVPTGSGNLCWRAAREFFAASGEESGLLIELRKSIPVASGLGGGSSDAAAVLRGLNALCGNLLGDADLLRLARGLGADVPFFLSPVPCFASGIGDVLSPVALGCDLYLVLANPGFPSPSSWAYARWDARGTVSTRDSGLLAAAMQAGRADDIAALAANDLEPPVLEKFPVLEMMASTLRAAGALTVHVSGSGPTLYALCSDETQRAAADAVRAEFGPRTWVREAVVRAHA